MPVLNDNQLHLYLPQLKEIGFKSPSKRGIWSSDNGDEVLNKISESISISEADHKHEINSIPDIWARPLLFASNLTSAESPGHNRILNEWRGLLSLIALQKISHHPISFARLNVHDILGYTELKTALVNLIPPNVQWDKTYDWDTIILVKLDDFIIGALSPSTLVYTGTSIKKILARYPSIHKDSDGYLCPPKSTSDRQQLEALFFWIVNVKQKISKIASGSKASEILKLFDRWQEEIVASIGLDSREMEQQIGEKFALEEKPKFEAEVASALSQYPIFNIILQSIEKKQTDKMSGLDLRPTLLCDKTVYVITENLLSNTDVDWGQLESIKAMKSLSAKQIIEKYFGRPWGDTFNNITLENAIWIRPDLLFLTDKLTGSEGGDLLTDENAFISKKYLIPLQSNILRYFSAQDVRDMLSPSFVEDGNAVNFSMHLPVGAGTCAIEKTYDLESGQSFSKISVPVLDLFPRNMGSNWKRYYLIYSDNDKIRVKPISSTLPQDEIKYYDVNRELVFNGVHQNVRISHFFTEESSVSSPYPDVFCFSDLSNHELGLVLNLEEKPIGSSAQKECFIGVDFGTTNTNIYLEMEGEKKKLSIDIPKYYKQITVSDNISREHILNQVFIPVAPIKMPVPSTVRIFDKANTEHVLADYFLYKLSGGSEQRLPDNVYSDIKWTEIDKQKQFFNSLLFLIFMEANNPRDQYTVQKIEFRFSYPKVFNENEKGSFSTNWKGAIGAMYKYLMGRNNNLGLINTRQVNGQLVITETSAEQIMAPNSELFLLSEGESSGLYAMKKGIAMGDGPIILDIGGGTTDISIWDDYDVLFDCSVKLAGRQLTKLFMVNSNVREKLFTKRAKETLDEHQKNEEKFNVYVNYFLNEEEEKIMNKLPLNATNPDIQWIKKLIMLEFCALIYYCGQAYYNAKRNKTITNNVMIFWGGNAARFIKWIDNGNFHEDGLANKMFHWLLANTIYMLDKENRPDNPYKLPKTTTKLSPEFKSEASGGLVIPAQDDLLAFSNAKKQRTNKSAGSIGDIMFEEATSTTVQIENRVIPGDVIVLKQLVEGLTETKLKSYEYISDKLLFPAGNGSNVADVTLEKLKDFISIYNKAGVHCGYLNPSDQLKLEPSWEQDIKTSVKNVLLKQAYLEPGDRVLEPIFIMEINKYLELLISER